MQESKGLKLLFLGTLIQRGIAFAGTYLLSQYVGSEALGYYALVLANVSIFGSFTFFGIGPMVLRGVAASENTDSVKMKYFVLSTMIGIILAFLVIMLSGKISEYFYDNQHLELIRYSGICIICSAVVTFCISYLNAVGQYFKSALFGTLNGFLTICFVYVYTLIYGETRLHEGYLISQLSIVMIGFFMLRIHNVIFYLKDCMVDVKKDIVFNNFSLMSGVLQGISNWIIVYIILTKDDGLKLLGVYHIFNQLYSMLLLYPNVLGFIKLKMYSKVNSNDYSSNSSLIGFIILLGTLVSYPIFNYIFNGMLDKYFWGYMLVGVTAFFYYYKIDVEQKVLATGDSFKILKANVLMTSVYLLGSFLFSFEILVAIFLSKSIGYLLFKAFIGAGAKR